MLESAYEACLCHELHLQGLAFKRQLELPVVYKGLSLECAYRIDLLVEDAVIVEIKAVEKLQPVFEAQLLTYMKLMQKRFGLLINFNAPVVSRAHCAPRALGSYTECFAPGGESVRCRLEEQMNHEGTKSRSSTKKAEEKPS